MIIRRRNKQSVPGLNMASMPDLIFTVLFFFMIVTHMRNETVQVKYQVPEGTELAKATKRHCTANIYIGKDASGKNRIQLNGDIVEIEQIGTELSEVRSQMPASEQEELMVNLRADRKIPMETVNAVKLELRKCGVLKIRYVASELKDEK